MSRKNKSERITSPEKLDSYLRVIRPPMWVTLIAVFGIVAAIVVWAFLYNMTMTVSHVGYVINHSVMMVTDGDSARYLKVGQKVTIGQETTQIESIEKKEQEEADELLPEEERGKEMYVITAKTNKNDGVYDTKICVDGISPISFLFD